jgi:hypothetical protein
MDWFMQGIEAGCFEVVNPYNGQTFLVPAGPQDVHSIVFWSKNFEEFIRGDYGPTLESRGYHLWFNFTVNSDSVLLEPNLPPLTARLNQLEQLCQQHDPRSVQWRFDPICFYRNAADELQDNLQDFSSIADAAAQHGITHCVTSFMDMYPKIRKRLTARTDITWVEVSTASKIDILADMVTILEPLGISLQTCCEGELLDQIGKSLPVEKSVCIPNDRLVGLYGGQLSMAQDRGQRIQNGCGCKISKDIGSYKQQPCYHNCLYCYANPTDDGFQAVKPTHTCGI